MNRLHAVLFVLVLANPGCSSSSSEVDAAGPLPDATPDRAVSHVDLTTDLQALELSVPADQSHDAESVDAVGPELEVWASETQSDVTQDSTHDVEIDVQQPLPPYDPTGFVGTDGVNFRDETGRVLLLRGVNVSNASKSAPFFPQWLLPQHFEMLARRGHNLVRLLIIWEAIEPEEGVFDQDYLDMIEEKVQWATDAGLYVLLDMHQDIWGPKFGGDGAPEWATLDHGLPFDPPPGHWFLKYGEPAVSQAFQSFYDNEQGIRDHFIMAFQEVARRFAGNPGVVGYDIINEPWFGNWDILDSEGFESQVLTPFYAAVTQGIREEDPNHLVFLEPTATKSLAYKGGMGPIGDPLVAYAPHYYNPGLEWFGEYLDEKAYIEPIFKLLKEEAYVIGGPVLLGEYGFYVGAKGASRYNRDQMELVEQYQFGTAAWSFDPGTGWFNLLTPDLQANWSLDLLSSPYPRRVNGRLVSWHYARGARSLTVEIDPTGWEAGDSVFFVPETHYPHGVEVTCPDQQVCPSFHDSDAQLVHVETADWDGSVLTITVRPSQEHPRPLAGFSTHISPTAGKAQQQELEMEEQLGIEVLRRDFKWSKIESQDDLYEPHHYDDLVNSAGERDMEVVALLDYSVDWAEEEPGNYSSILPAQFGDFAGAVAAHFSDRLKYYEIWNEQNTERFWPPEPDPAHYGKLLKAAYTRIKEEDPDSVVLLGGLASLNIYLGVGWEFLGRLFHEHPDIGNYMDAVAIHPYTLVQTLPPEEENAAATYGEMIDLARETLGDYGAEHLPLVITEMGWPACLCPPLQPPPFTPNVTYEQQAWYLVRSYVLAASAGLDMYLWYDFMDGSGGGDLFSENYFGVVQYDADIQDGVPPETKPSYTAYQVMLELLGDTTYGADMAPDQPHCHVHRFLGPGRQVYVAWASSQAPCQALLPEGQPGDEILDYLGQSLDGPNLEVGPAPTYYVFSTFD